MTERGVVSWPICSCQARRNDSEGVRSLLPFIIVVPVHEPGDLASTAALKVPGLRLWGGVLVQSGAVADSRPADTQSGPPYLFTSFSVSVRSGGRALLASGWPCSNWFSVQARRPLPGASARRFLAGCRWRRWRVACSRRCPPSRPGRNRSHGTFNRATPGPSFRCATGPHHRWVRLLRSEPDPKLHQGDLGLRISGFVLPGVPGDRPQLAHLPGLALFAWSNAVRRCGLPVLWPCLINHRRSDL